jgi:hypothetical protein
MKGPGKYDDICTAAREAANARAAVVIIFGGNKGPGFSVQGDVESLVLLPRILRNLADDIEKDTKRLAQ